MSAQRARAAADGANEFLGESTGNQLEIGIFARCETAAQG
jgi:hypothetical protein